MHRCLSIPEIRYHIVSFVFDNDSDFPDEPTLFSLVQTGTLFYELALDALWHTQYGLLPLVKCMPPDSWEEYEKEVVSISHPLESGSFIGQQEFIRPIELSDCARFIFHAQRIRCLYPITSLEGNTAALATLGACLVGSPFTRLHKLWFTPEMPPMKHLLLVPTLTTVKSIRARVFHCLIQELPSKCPSLKSIELRNYSSADDILVASQLVRSFTSLEWITVEKLDEPALVHLGSIPQLKGLRFTPPPGLQPLPLQGSFRSLRNLIFSGKGLEECTTWLKSIGTLHIHHLTIETSCDNHDHWTEFARALPSCCVRETLRNIRITNLPGYTPAAPLDTIKQFISFPQVTNFEFYGGTWFVDDDCIKDMAMSWPFLEQLSIRTYHPARNLTLESLVHLAKYCKSLTKAKLFVDCTTIPSSLLDNSLEPQTALEILDLNTLIPEVTVSVHWIPLKVIES